MYAGCIKDGDKKISVSDFVDEVNNKLLRSELFAGTMNAKKSSGIGNMAVENRYALYCWRHEETLQVIGEHNEPA